MWGVSVSYQLLLSWSCCQVSSVVCEVSLWAISYCYLDLVVRYYQLCVRCLCELSATAILILLSGIIGRVWGVSVSYQLLLSWSCSQVSPVVCEVSLWAISYCYLDLVVRYHQLCVRCLCELSATAILILLSGIIGCVWGVSVSYQLLLSWSCSQVSSVICEVSLWAISCCCLDLVVRHHQLCVRCLCELSAAAILIL